MPTNSEKLDAIEVVVADAPLAAEIRGVDLSQTVSETKASAIRSALLGHGVIFFSRAKVN